MGCKNFSSFNLPLREFFFSPPPPPPHKFSNGSSLNRVNRTVWLHLHLGRSNSNTADNCYHLRCGSCGKTMWCENVGIVLTVESVSGVRSQSFHKIGTLRSEKGDSSEKHRLKSEFAFIQSSSRRFQLTLLCQI